MVDSQASNLARNQMSESRARERTRKADAEIARRNRLSYEFAGYNSNAEPLVAVDNRTLIESTQLSNGSLLNGERIAPIVGTNELFIRGRDSVNVDPRRRPGRVVTPVSLWLSQFFGGTVTTTEEPTRNSLEWLSWPPAITGWDYYYNGSATPPARFFNFNTDVGLDGFGTQSIGGAIRIITINQPSELRVELTANIVQPLTTYGTSEGSPVFVAEPVGLVFSFSLQVWKINPISPIFTAPLTTWDSWVNWQSENFAPEFFPTEPPIFISDYQNAITAGDPIQIFGFQGDNAPNDVFNLTVPFSGLQLSNAFPRKLQDFNAITALRYSILTKANLYRTADALLEPWFDLFYSANQVPSDRMVYFRGLTSTSPSPPPQVLTRYGPLPEGETSLTHMDPGTYLVQIQLFDSTPASISIYTNNNGFSYIGAQTLQNRFNLALDYLPQIPT